MSRVFPTRVPMLKAGGVLLAVLGLAALLIGVHPIGYSGGGSDDWHYLEAARCAAAHGFCAPPNHWWTRFPLILPMAAAIGGFGENPVSVALAPLCYAVAAIALFTMLVARHCGALAALFAGLALVMTAVFARLLLQPGVDVPELAFMLGAATAASHAAARSDAKSAILAGVLLALAVQTRMAGFALFPVLAVVVALAPARLRSLILPALAGFVATIALELVMYLIATGDPLHGWRLALGHTRIPSMALSPGVDTSQSPLFNPAYIAGWGRPMGIHVHWTVDGALNLIANPAIGPVFLLMLALFVQRRDQRSWRDPAILLLAGACVYAGALIYALAVDPSPRMFLPVVAVAAALVGHWGAVAWRRGERALIGLGLVLLAGVAVMLMHDRVDIGSVRSAAARWALEHRGGVSIDDGTRRFLTLDRTIRSLPVFPAGDADRVIAIAPDMCAKTYGDARFVLARQMLLSPPERPLTRLARQIGLALAPSERIALCEFTRQPNRVGARPMQASRPLRRGA